MNPATIEKLLDLADKIERTRYDHWVSFSLRWIAWEALRTRILVVACRFRGWKMQDAYKVIGKKRISSNASFFECMKLILGPTRHPFDKGKAGQAWNFLKRIELVRNRLFHGYKTVDPIIVNSASRFLSKALRNQKEIFGDMEVQYGKGISHKIRDVLIRRPAIGKKIPIKRSLNELEAVLETMGGATKTRPIPSVAEAKKWEKVSY